MYHEVVGFKNNKVFLFVIAAFVFFLLVSMIELLNEILRPLYSNLIVLAAFVLLALIFVRYFICEFKYSVISYEFVIYKAIGRRETIAARIDIGKAVCLAPYKSEELSKYRRFHSSCNTTSLRTCGKRYVMVYEKDGKLCRLMFQPSAKLLQILNEKLAEKTSAK